MTKQIEIGSALQLSSNTRLIYLGDDKARLEKLREERTATGGKIVDRAPILTWVEHPDEDKRTVSLNAQQIAFWHSKI